MISSNKNEDTPLTTPMNIQSEVTEGLTILRSYQVSAFSAGSILRQEPTAVTDGEVRMTPCSFAPKIPIEMLSDGEKKLYYTLNRVNAQIYRFSYLVFAILCIPFAIMLPIFMAFLDYGLSYFRPMLSAFGRLINDVSPLLYYRTALARNALIDSTGRTLQNAEEGKFSSTGGYTVLV